MSVADPLSFPGARCRALACALLACAALTPGDARAFCGFYVAGSGAQLQNAGTHVVLMRDGTRTVLSMQNDYQGPPSDFAMVVPVPVVLHEEDVHTLDRGVFERVNQLAAPRLVEYWERDPCAPEVPMAPRATGRGRVMDDAARSAPAGAGQVVVEAQFAVGEYEIVILSANDSGALDRWLRQNGYQIPAGAEAVLRPYVQQHMKFFVAKVDVSRVTFEQGRAVLSPLRVSYESESFSLPVRLGLLNSGGEQELLVHILAPNQRYEVANYPNVTVPTNINVQDRTRDEFGRFYEALLRETLAANPGAVVTEYAWQASSCDPCPGGQSGLSPTDLQTLGANTLGGAPLAPPGRPLRVGPAPRGRALPGGGVRPPGRMAQPSYVLTRLHYRYAPTGLGEDLVFRAAPPIEGGRESTPGHGAQPATMNNFQARYAIRHAFAGPITCQDPVRGRWGPPPSSERAGGARGGGVPLTPPGLSAARQPSVGATASAPYRGEGSAWNPAAAALVPTAPTTQQPALATTVPELPPPPPALPAEPTVAGCATHGPVRSRGVPYGLVAFALLALAGRAPMLSRRGSRRRSPSPCCSRSGTRRAK